MRTEKVTVQNAGQRTKACNKKWRLALNIVKNTYESNGNECGLSLESVLEKEAHEHFCKLSVSKWKGPETKVGGSVGHSTKNEFNGFNHLVNEILAESVGFRVTHVLKLLVEGLHFVFSLLDELIALADILTVSNSLIATAISALNTLDTSSITISDVSEFDFILSWLVWVGSQENHRLNKEHDWDENNNEHQKNQCDFELPVLVAIWDVADPLLLDTFWLTEGEDHDNHDVDYTRSSLVFDVTCHSANEVIAGFTLRIVVELLGRYLSGIFDINSVEPFGNDKCVHPAEKSPKDDVSGNDLGDKSGIVTVVDGVGTFDEDSHAHVDNTEDDGHLHLNIVDQGKFVAGKAPNWILTDQISAIEVKSGVYVSTGNLHCFRMSIIHSWMPYLSFLHVVAWSKDVSLNREELVINQSAVSGKETHHENKISELQSILESWVRFQGVVEKGQNKTEQKEEGTVTHVTEHHSEEVWESHDRDQGWVSF